MCSFQRLGNLPSRGQALAVLALAGLGLAPHRRTETKQLRAACLEANERRGWLGVGHGRSGVQPSTAATRPEEEARAGLDLHDEISRGARRAQARSAALYRWCVEAGGEWNLVETTGNLAENGGLRWLKIAGHTISGHT